MPPTDYNALAQLLMSQGLVSPALFHGPRVNQTPLPQARPQARQSQTPRPMPMPDRNPARPGMPNRNPERQKWESPSTANWPPAPEAEPTKQWTKQSGAELERRLREINPNPFVAQRGKFWDDPWGTLLQRVTQPSPNLNVPKSAIDPYIEQALMLGLPIGRLGAGLAATTKVGKTAVDAAFSPQQWAAIYRSGGRDSLKNVADNAKPIKGATRTYSAPPKSPQTMTEELRALHKQVKRDMPIKSPRKIAPYSAAEKKRVRDAALEARRRNQLIQQLREKGELDAAMRGLLRSR